MFNRIQFFSWIIILIFIFIVITGFDKCSGNPPENPSNNPPNNLPGNKSRIIKESSNVIDTIKTGFKDRLLCIYKLNAGRIIASGNNGLIITSSNGGLNWDQRSSNDTMNFYAATMLNQRTYIVAGEYGRIRRSADFGQTWNVSVSPAGNTIKSISFSDTLNGYAANGTTSILKTNDGGLTWSTISTSAAGNINSVSTPSNGFVVACGDGGAITASTDAGVTWSNKSSGVIVNLNSIYMLNSAYGKIAGNSGTILTTLNGGSNWFIDTTNTNVNLKSITISSPNLSFSCGDTAVLRKQNTGWIKLGVKDNFHSISIPKAYCSAICDDEIRIVGSENCPCSHIINLIYNNDSHLWELTVTPDMNQNIRDLIRIEVGGTIEDHTISGWTEYDNINNGNTLDYAYILGNETMQVTNSTTQTINIYDYLEIPLNEVTGIHSRCVKFKIIPINTGSVSSNYNVPLYLNFLNTERTSCLTKRYLLDCTP